MFDCIFVVSTVRDVSLRVADNDQSSESASLCRKYHLIAVISIYCSNGDTAGLKAALMEIRSVIE